MQSGSKLWLCGIGVLFVILLHLSFVKKATPTLAFSEAASSGLNVAAARRVLRLLFVGDSITTGVASKEDRTIPLRRPKAHPTNGTCSYRAPLIHSLMATAAGSFELETVGERSGAHAGRLPLSCGLKRGQLLLHHAVWGTTAAAIAKAIAALKERKRKTKGEPLYEFDVAVVLIGTNDLSKSFERRKKRKKESSDAVVNSEAIGGLMKAIDEIVSLIAGNRSLGRGGGWEWSMGVGGVCRRISIVLPLLPRADVVNADVDRFNAVLSAALKERHGACEVPAVFDGGEDGSWRDIFDVEKHTYDGLHPNSAGEQVIAKVVFNTISSAVLHSNR